MSMDTTHRFLICYDVVDDPRRSRLAKALQAYGDRIQYSVFLIDAKPAKIVRLRAAIRQIINSNTDSVLICSLGPCTNSATNRLEFVGRERAFTDHGPMIL